MRNKDIPIVFLHGWGISGNTYVELKKILQKKGYTVFFPDLPGFGEEKLENNDMSLGDYSCFVADMVHSKKISKFVLVGHSFGGRVALHYAAHNKDSVKLLVLTGVPIIRHFGIKQKIYFVGAKSLKYPISFFPEKYERLSKKFLYRVIGEQDYVKSEDKRTIFKNIINEPLIPYLKKITSSIVLIWGENDKMTPASDLNVISHIGNIKDFRIIGNAGHSFVYQDPVVFADVLDEFIQKYA